SPPRWRRAACRRRRAPRARGRATRPGRAEKDGRAAGVRGDRAAGVLAPRIPGERAAMSAEPAPATPAVAAAAIRGFQETFTAVRREIARVVVGHENVIELILTAFFAGGHVLIEGVPGIGKTLIVRSLAEALNLSFNRIQFTVDLMPADITGTRVIN